MADGPGSVEQRARRHDVFCVSCRSYVNDEKESVLENCSISPKTECMEIASGKCRLRQ